MRSLGFVLVAVAVVLPARADQTSPAQARQCWLRGDYEKAAKLYQQLAQSSAGRDAATIGLSRAWQSQGKYDQSLAVIDARAQQTPANADLQARRAELLFLRGRWTEADSAAHRALEHNPEHFLARWILAEVHRARGELQQAEADFRWFVRTYSARSDADRDIQDPDELLLVGLAGCENARWNCLPEQFQFIVNNVFGEASKNDKDFWPADCQTGLLYLEKYNQPDALAALEKALAINPYAVEALVGKGLAALQRYEISDAEKLAERALSTNPASLEALNLKASVLLSSGSAARALSVLARAQEINPRDEVTLGRIAACLVLEHRDTDFQRLVEEVVRNDPRPGIFYVTLADQLDERRRFQPAERFYQKAASAWPMLSAAPSALGLLFMRMGREDEARPLLEKAFAADSFNVRVKNMITVLDQLSKFQSLKTAHFVLRFDPKNDNILARYLPEYLESVYAELSTCFNYQIGRPILVEVFDSHEMFSTRVTALPDLHTIAASTGLVVAMVSPKSKDVGKPFNWARVVRHELTHVFNLEQTAYQVPHWLTEGLAVRNESFPPPADWQLILARRLQENKLFDLQTIDLGFIRPRSMEEWTLAYCQSYYYVEYLESAHGTATICRLLRAYGQDIDTPRALAAACALDQATFEQGYRRFVAQRLQSLRVPTAAAKESFAQLRSAHQQDPANYEISAQLAVALLERKRIDEARKLAEDVLARKPAQALAAYVKARLLLDDGHGEQAQGVLEAALAQQPVEPRVLRELGRLYLGAMDYARAAEMFELGRTAQPYDNKWLADLVHTYEQAGDRDKQANALKQLVLTDGDDMDRRKQLARLLLDMGDFNQAQKYAREAVQIDVQDPAVQQALADALFGQNQWGAAVPVYQLVLELEPHRDAARGRLAQALLRLGKKQEAAEEIARILAHDPENAEAKRLRALVER
jgi:tetratricopeptide (TPR) repeat protein